MKYFRTKDAIYSYEPIHDIDVDGFVIQHNITGWSKPIMKEDIVKITDTIEELCDEFVDTSGLKVSSTSTGGWLYDEFDSKNKCLVYYAEDERRTIPLNEFDDLSKIYGAIWCEWGLKYVAKMNDKGELELL